MQIFALAGVNIGHVILSANLHQHEEGSSEDDQDDQEYRAQNITSPARDSNLSNIKKSLRKMELTDSTLPTTNLHTTTAAESESPELNNEEMTSQSNILTENGFIEGFPAELIASATADAHHPSNEFVQQSNQHFAQTHTLPYQSERNTNLTVHEMFGRDQISAALALATSRKELQEISVYILHNPRYFQVLATVNSLAERFFRKTLYTSLEFYATNQLTKLQQVLPGVFPEIEAEIIKMLIRGLVFSASITGTHWPGKVIDDSGFPGYCNPLAVEAMFNNVTKLGMRIDEEKFLTLAMENVVCLGLVPRILRSDVERALRTACLQ